MFHEDLIELAEAQRPVLKRTRRNAALDAVVGVIDVFRLLLVLIAAMTFPLHLVIRLIVRGTGGLPTVTGLGIAIELIVETIIDQAEGALDTAQKFLKSHMEFEEPEWGPLNLNMPYRKAGRRS